jgi:cystathionine beta-lyase
MSTAASVADAFVPGFDDAPERRDTFSTKWDRYRDGSSYRDVLPFWVADMEFRTPDAIVEALRARVDHGVFGYTQVPATLTEATLAFLSDRYGWAVEPEWLVWIPGVVPGLNLACAAAGEPGDAVMTAAPVYYPFLSAPGNGGREKIETRLVLDRSMQGGERWVMDLDEISERLTPRTRLFMLCNPQNPTGRVYDRAELTALAERLLARDVVLLSDEIHAELLLAPGAEHVPVATLSPEIAERTITLMAATKTYNIPGLSCAYAIIPDAPLRRAFRRAGRGLLAGTGPLAFAASEAAYRHGEPWRQQLLSVLRRNERMLREAVADIDGLAMTPVEATCLAWIDARGTALEDPHAFFEAAGVGLSPGPQFGGTSNAGDCFVRFNFGCPRGMLEEGIQRMRAALEAHR